MAKKKFPHKRHPLKPLPREEYTPRADKPEAVTIRERGYWPGSAYSPDEIEFLKAVERWQKRHRTKFLASIAFLRIALELGYRRSPPPTPPNPAARMNADAILARMVEAGFSFHRGPDGEVSFTPPPGADADPERQHLLGVLAWGWGWLAPYAFKYATPAEEPSR